MLKLAFYIGIYGVPALGIWLISSLVALTNRSLLLPLIAGILLFPGLPFVWEWYASMRRIQKGVKPVSFTFWDRITLRTLALSVVAIGFLLATLPTQVFLALSIRGDWMLRGSTSAVSEFGRGALFRIADGLEWTYVLVSPNPFLGHLDPAAVEAHGPKNAAPAHETPLWPWEPSRIHPLVREMPAFVETSIESVAEYIAERESHPHIRIKALHDYVADRVEYDARALFVGKIPSQDAQSVFENREAVCAGYANLFAALGKEAGEEVVIVSGYARTETGELSDQGHAWNAVSIDGKWHLVDTTWDSGSVKRGRTFVKGYGTEYLFTPPEIFGVTHFPNDPDWQLRERPLSRGEFLRQPMMKPRFFAQGMTLVSPKRSQTDVEERATIEIRNPKKQLVIAKFNARGRSVARNPCDVDVGSTTLVTCDFPKNERYYVSLFSSSSRLDRAYQFVGRLHFNRRSR